MSDKAEMMPDSVLSFAKMDLVDAVFLRRHHSGAAAATAATPCSALEPASPPAEESVVGSSGSAAPPRDAIDVDRSVVEWLLEKVPAQWAALATTVEHAVADGLRVIAMTGGSHGEGRTTIVAGLAATLRARGWRVIVVAGPVTEAGEVRYDSGSDRRVVLVDAGVWFPPGPIRCDRVASLAGGCDAAIIVRRSAQPPSPVWAAAIEQAGCRVVGEVVTFEEFHRAET